MINLKINPSQENLKNWEKTIEELIKDNYDFINFHESKQSVKIKLPDDNQNGFLSSLEDKIADGVDFSLLFEPSKEAIFQKEYG